MDLSSGFDIPNPYGLLASDFGYDTDGYTVAIKFLSDLSGGTDENKALEQNGGAIPMLRAWERSDKFRRVLAKCRAAGVAQRALRAADEGARATPEGEGVGPAGQRFVPLDEVPGRQTPFTMHPSPGTFSTGSV